LISGVFAIILALDKMQNFQKPIKYAIMG